MAYPSREPLVDASIAGRIINQHVDPSFEFVNSA
jgi:hypothetical protein